MSATLSLMLGLALTRGQDAKAPLSYTATAVTVSRALADLSKLSGQVLTASPQTAGEIVVLRLDKVALDEAKKRLADVVAGAWQTQADGSELLVADEAKRRAEKRAEEDQHLKGVQGALKRMAESLKPPKPDPENVEGVDFSVGDTGKLMANLALSLTAGEIAAVPKSGRVVYSTSPTAMQRRLNVRGLEGLVAEFVKSFNQNIDMSAAAESATNENMEKAKRMAELMGVPMPQPAKKVSTPVVKVLFIVERGGRASFMGDFVTLSFRLVDATGAIVASSQEPLGDMGDVSAPMDAEGIEKVPEEDKPKPQDPALNKPFTPSKLTAELMALANFQSMGPSTTEPSADLLDRLLHPDVYDPLSFEESEGLIAWSQAKGESLAACLPDDAAGTMGSWREKATLAAVKQFFESSGATQITEADGWMTVRPAKPDSARQDRLDRVALARFIQAEHGAQLPSLDNLAAYAVKNPPFLGEQVAMRNVFLTCPASMTMGMRGVQDWEMLRLYGLLTEGQRRSLRSGQVLPFGSLGSSGTGIARQMVYGAGARFEVGPPPPKAKFSFMGWFGGMGADDVKDLRQEPTELLPNGLPAQGGLALTVEMSKFASPVSTGNSVWGKIMGAMGPEEAGMMWSFLDNPQMSQFSAMMPKMDKFRVGDRENLQFNLVLAPDVRQPHNLVSDTMAKDAAVVEKDKLPADFLAKANEIAKLFKEGFGDFMQMGMPGSGVPPQN